MKEFPKGILDQHMIALGKTGSGKSSKLRVFVEQLLEESSPVCILDVKGDWWGIKSSADGKKPGYPVVIFGGKHADIPINPTRGAELADLIFTGNRPCVIDMRGWMPSERTQFFLDFASTAFKVTKGKRYLVISEVHNFCPKGKVFSPEAGKMLHWANRLASEGRGLGLTLLADSQRPQKVHNDFLTSCETLVACKVIHKADRDAIKDWVDGCADIHVGKQVLESLAQLKKPEAWVWSPEIEFGPKLVQFPLFKTFDSFKPQEADAPAQLKGWAAVDLDAVKAKLTSVVEEAKANDPIELKRRIAELEREARKQQPAPPADPAAAEKAYNTGYDLGQADGWNAAISKLAEFKSDMKAWTDAMPMPEKLGPMPEKQMRHGLKAGAIVAVHRAPAPAAPRPVVVKSNGDGKVSSAEMKVLTVLSQFPEGCQVGKLTLLTGYRYSGGFRNTLSSLRSAGYLEGDNGGTLKITPAGEALGPFPELPQGDDLLNYWLTHPSFGAAARKALEVLSQGEQLDGPHLAKAAGYEFSGGFRNALSELRTAGVIIGRNGDAMRISPDIMP